MFGMVEESLISGFASHFPAIERKRSTRDRDVIKVAVVLHDEKIGARFPPAVASQFRAVGLIRSDGR
jgi:hypothetical protein